MFGLDLSWIIYIGFAILMFYMMSKGGGCCGGHGGHDNGGGHSHGGHEHGNAGNTMSRDLETFKDPVCGMYVTRQNAVTRSIDGQTYYFCSESCANEFSRRWLR